MNSNLNINFNLKLILSGAEPSPGGIVPPNRIPTSPSKTSRQYYQQNRQQPAYQRPIPQQPAKPRPVYQQPQQPVYQQPQQPAKQRPVYQQPIPQQPVYQQQPSPQYEDNGFVEEPVKKIRPTYKVVKTPQQPVNYQPNVSPPKVYISPAKSKLQQEALPLDQLGPNINYQQQETYQQSDSYFSQEQTSGNWKPIQQQQVRQQYQPQQYSPQQPVRQYQKSVKQTASSQNYYSNQQPSIRKTSSKQQFYNQPSNSQNGWKAIKPGGYSYNEIAEQKIDINIPKTNFKCEGKPYEPGNLK